MLVKYCFLPHPLTRVLDEGKRIELSKFVPHSAFLAILQPKVGKISHIPVEFVEKVWDYIEDVVISVFKHHSENNHQLQMGIKRACHALVEKMKGKSKNWALEMRMTAYWKIVMRRLVDSMALHLQLRVRNLVNKELEKEVVSKLIASHDGKIEKMLEDSPAIAAKREKLNASIRLLSHSKDVLADIMDNLASM
ncbi:hypothetical protein Tsubulata_046793, partial [Turnera subulata]